MLGVGKGRRGVGREVMQSSNLGLLARLEGSSSVGDSPNVPPASMEVFGMSPSFEGRSLMDEWM